MKRSQLKDFRSHSRLDNPKDLLRSLQDNVGKYQIEAVGTIDQTHRYRGITDFHYSTYHGKFMTKFRETILPGNMESLRKFTLDPSKGPHPNEEIIPPPTLSDKVIPINWGYHQNSTIKVTTDASGNKTLTNQSAIERIKTFYVPYDIPTVPSHPPPLPAPEPVLASLLSELYAAMNERPIWTRRAILNRVSKDNPGLYLIKPAIQYIGYQFRGGPWRDAIVRYGIDPRTDPQYRIYQTLFFKIVDEQRTNETGTMWHDIRSEYTRKAQRDNGNDTTHIFDGTSVSLDGKIWQVCDITEPLLVKLLSTNELREKCEVQCDGWFLNGRMAKVRSVMRTLISAIRLGREMTEEDFKTTLAFPDHVEGKAPGRVVAPMPNLKLLIAAENADDEAGIGGDGVEGSVADMLGEEGERTMQGGMSSAYRKRRARRALKMGLVPATRAGNGRPKKWPVQKGADGHKGLANAQAEEQPRGQGIDATSVPVAGSYLEAVDPRVVEAMDPLSSGNGIAMGTDMQRESGMGMDDAADEDGGGEGFEIEDDMGDDEDEDENEDKDDDGRGEDDV
jgi:hypothetical protein